MRANSPVRVCRVVTVPITFATLLRQQMKVIADKGFDLTLVCSPGSELDSVARECGASAHAIPMRRAISPLSDLGAVWRLTCLFRAARFHIVHSSTPKAGLITAFAGRLARVPIRMHTYTGQPWVTMQGWSRHLARAADRIVAALDTRVYTDSASQRDFLISQGIVRVEKISVLASGSISGVDLARFDPAKWGGAVARATRRALGIADDALVIVFLGRVTRDKGIVELLSAFDLLHSPRRVIELVLVGPLEPERDPLPMETLDRLTRHPRIHVVGFVVEPERYFGASDVFCLPSYREGFGTVAIEAAAMGLPAVVSSIYGLTDAVVPNQTGLWCKPKDVESLHVALQQLVDDAELRHTFGAQGRTRARQLFDARSVNQAVVDEYRRMLDTRGG